MSMITPLGKQQFFDSIGNPLVGGKLFTYEPSTTTPKATWSDSSSTTLNSNPIILDARGECLAFGNGLYRVDLTDADDNFIWSVNSIGIDLTDLEATLVSLEDDYANSSADSVIINGECAVVQRAAATLVGTGTIYAGPDMYVMTNAGAGGSLRQMADTIVKDGIIYAAVRQECVTPVVSLAAGNAISGITQRVEGFNSAKLRDGSFVISFLFLTNVAGVFAVAVNALPNTHSYVDSFTVVANVPRLVSILVPPPPIAANMVEDNNTGMTVSVGGLNSVTFVGAYRNWAAGPYFAVAGAVNWAQGGGNFIALTQLDVRAGTKYRKRNQAPYSDVFSQCRRYSRPWGRGATGIWTSANTIRIAQPFDTPMRIPPAATILSATPTVENWAVGVFNGVGSVITANLCSAIHGEMTVNGFVGGPVTAPLSPAYSSSDVAYLSADL